jgi:hypothetical protein
MHRSVQRWGSKEIQKTAPVAADMNALRQGVAAAAAAPKDGPSFSQGYGGKARPSRPPSPTVLAAAPDTIRRVAGVRTSAALTVVQFGDVENQTTESASGLRADANFVPSKAFPLGSASEFLKSQPGAK